MADQKNNVEEGFFYNNKKIGLWTTKTHEGILLEERVFYDTNVNRVHETKYYLNGNIISSGFYISHPYLDTVTVFDIRTKREKKIYVTDKLMQEGKWSYYYKNGTFESEGNYRADIKVGKWTYYSEDGVIIKTEEYVE